MIRRFLDRVLIREWPQALKMWSIRLALALGMAAEGWAMLEDDVKSQILDMIPDNIERHFLFIFSLVLLFMRLKNQGIGK